ncbi:MAG: restriction endonuclease subunit S [Thermoguttaceae bacterium]|jgi:type I restriction enzyme S subunit|nr:restriction endonuclease subunit S [Thermoguttaceae bacterium]
MSHNGWPRAFLGDVTKPIERPEAPIPGKNYRQIGVRLWGAGAYERERLDGAVTQYSFLHRVEAGDIIVNKIWARHGSVSVVPAELAGCYCSGEFPLFRPVDDRLSPQWFYWITKTRWFWRACDDASRGTTGKSRIKPEKFAAISIPLPSRDEQDRIVAKIDAVAGKIEEAKQANSGIATEAAAMLRSAFDRITSESPRMPLAEVAPIVRRHVDVRMGGVYPELGIRSFGKGTFHKPSLDFLAVGTKKLYQIEPGDLVFNNVFAWEGAIAVAQPEDAGRVGSHRFITCVPQPGVATAGFLCFYLLTPEGLEKIGEASPGGAGRNRTLGLEKLMRIEVPVPAFERQLWFDRLQGKVREMLAVEQEMETELDSMLPSVLDRAFKGAL